MKILFFPFGTIYTPSSRTRCFIVSDTLKNAGVKTKICGSRKIRGKINILLKFIDLVTHLPFYDILYFNKSAHWSTYFFVKFAHWLKKKVVIDIDDSEFLKNRYYDLFFKKCDAVIAGSHFIFKYAKKFNKNVYLAPTSVNPQDYVEHKDLEKDNVVIGWTGTAGNINYLKIVEEPLKDLLKKYKIIVRVIADRNKTQDLKIPIDFVRWSLEKGNEEISKFDIGIMPLEDTEWERGKCALKAIEYMASRIPVVISAVGENRYLVKEGKNGFLARTKKEWELKLEKLIRDKELRVRIANEGFKTVTEMYDVSKNSLKLKKILSYLLESTM